MGPSVHVSPNSILYNYNFIIFVSHFYTILTTPHILQINISRRASGSFGAETPTTHAVLNLLHHRYINITVHYACSTVQCRQDLRLYGYMFMYIFTHQPCSHLVSASPFSVNGNSSVWNTPRGLHSTQFYLSQMRIQDFPRGAPTWEVGALTYYFGVFPRKLHNIEKKLDPGPLDPLK